jgi:hypothetical protein
MHLVKWIRKNERKLMAFVVIFIMLSFVGGTALMQILERMGTGSNKAFAHFGDKGRMTPNKIMQARAELMVLKVLRGDIFCRFRTTRYGAPDFRSRLLGQILFPDSQSASDVNNELKQAMGQGQLKVDAAQIDNFFRQAGSNSELFWILLKAEAQEAGCMVSTLKASETLKVFISQIMQGQITAAQLVESIIKNQAVPEERVIRIFADLLGILTYAEIITENEDITTSQIRAAIARNRERIDAEYVKIGSEDFVDEQEEPSEEELLAHFNRYKVFPAGETSEDNPQGLGYKLPARVQIEYLIAKMDDIEGKIESPTEEELEQFYRRNVNSPNYSRLFQYEIPADANEPDGENITKTKTYAELTEQIRAILIREKRDRRADMIFNDARSIVEAGFENLDLNTATAEQLKSASGNYEEAAKKLSEKHEITVYSGKTGMLNAEDIASDGYLGQLAIEGRNQMPVYLGKIALAVEEAGGSSLGYFDVSKPKMWENIGPMKDRFGSVISIVRVIDAAKASEPEDLNMTFSTKGAVLAEAETETEEKLYSVKERIVGDFKLLTGMETAKRFADELANVVKEQGWEQGLAEFNKAHSKDQTDEDAKDEEAAMAEGFKLDKLTGQSRVASADIEQIKKFAVDNPMAAEYARNIAESKELVDKLYDLLPPGQTEAKEINALLELRTQGAWCLVKDVSRTAVTNEDYNKTKGMIAFQLNAARTDSLALIHFTPENILKRTKYELVQTDKEEQEEASTANQAGAESGGES